MSSSLNKLFEKGKAKVKEYQASHQQNQGYPSQQQYGGQPYPPQQYNAPSPSYNQYQQQSSYPGSPPPQGQQWSHNSQQWGPPQQQWSPPLNQWAPPPGQAPFSPPIPQHSKPQPPPIPANRPTSAQRPAPPPPQPHSSDPKVYWQPSFDASTPVKDNFRHEVGDHGWGNNEKQKYTDSSDNSFHHDGRLIVRGLVQNGTYTSARLTSHRVLARPRGYLTATILAPVAEGVWPAYWMLPQDPFSWPTDGEVDIFESWNGDCINHSCLHWGNYNGEDWNKHRVLETKLDDMSHQPHTFGFAWSEEDGIPNWRGRMIWYIDGRPAMKGNIPQGTRRMEDYRILINIAMGGNVCGGKLPKDGYYDMVISDLKMVEEPVGGWNEFERAWSHAPEGKTM